MQDFFTTTLSAAVTDANQLTIYLNSVPTNTEGYLVIDYANSTMREIIFYSAVGANYVTVPADGRGQGGTTAQAHDLGADVRQNMVAGYHDGLKNLTTVPDSKVLTRHIADANVTDTKLSTSAILLGMTQITSDFTTSTINQDVDITNLAVTVTVPSGGRAIEITASLPGVASSFNGAEVVYIDIMEGGTIIKRQYCTTPVQNGHVNASNSVLLTPAAGAHTYKVAIYGTGAGTHTVRAGATYPAQIFVKLI
jgi:hypothetical protein